MKPWKIVYSIICLPIIGFMLYQTIELAKYTNDIGGKMGYIVAALLTAVVILTIVTLKKSTPIIDIVIGGIAVIAAIFAFIGQSGLFSDLLIMKFIKEAKN